MKKKNVYLGLVAFIVSVSIGVTIAWALAELLENFETTYIFVRFLDDIAESMGFDANLELLWRAKIAQVFGASLIAVPLTRKVYEWLIKRY